MRRALALALLAAAALPGAAQAREKWDTKVFAPVPPPGFPAKAYVDPKGRVWEGTYVNPNGDTKPSMVFEFSPTGEMLRNFGVPGQQLDHEHGVQVATVDAKDRLVLLDRTPSRALILDPKTGRVTTYATFRDLHPCGSASAAPNECSQSVSDGHPFADYAAWGPDGSLYVTDYAQATIWRVPPRGGTPEVWLTDPLLDGAGFGTAGIWLLPDNKTFLVSQASGLGLSAGNPFNGALYTVQLAADGKPGPLKKLWESMPTDLPDGFAVAKSGNIYLCAVGLTTQIVQIAPDGTEAARFPSEPISGANGSPVPFDTPSGLAFLGTRLIVANQSALTGTTANMVLFDVEAGEEGQPEFIPANAGPLDAVGRSEPAAALTGKVVRRRGRAVTIRLSRAVAGTPARVTLSSGGRRVASGTLKGRTLRVTVRKGARLRGTLSLRGAKIKQSLRLT